MELTREKLRDIMREVAVEVLSTKDHAKDNPSGTYDQMVKAFREAAATPPAPVPPKKGLLAARFLRAVAAGKGDPARAAKFAAKEWGETDSPVVKALEASDAAAGGVLVPTEWSTDLIELLSERAVVRAAGPIILPMTAGSVQIPKLVGGSAASYVGESQNLPTTEPSFGMLTLTWKKLGAVVPFSNDLLRFAAVNADALVRDDAINAMREREDRAFLRDDGTEHTPKGIKYWVPTANRLTANATVNLANVTTDSASMILALRSANCRMIRPTWFWSPRTEMYLKTIRDTNGNFAFKPELDGGTYWGFPYFTTTEIPDNLGAGSDESEIYLVDMSDCVIGEANTLEVSASDTAAYHDGTAVRSAFSQDQTVLRLLAHHDFAVRHEESLVSLNAVTWSI